MTAGADVHAQDMDGHAPRWVDGITGSGDQRVLPATSLARVGLMIVVPHPALICTGTGLALDIAASALALAAD